MSHFYINEHMFNQHENQFSPYFGLTMQGQHDETQWL